MYAMQLRQPTLWVNNLLVLAVRHIAVTNVKRFFSLGWERSRSIYRSLKFSSHYWVHQVPA